MIAKSEKKLCKTYHGHTIAMVYILIKLPRSTKEIADNRHGTPVPANGQLSSFPLQPQHEFLGGGRSEVALAIAEDEIEDDIAWRRSQLAGQGPP